MKKFRGTLVYLSVVSALLAGGLAAKAGSVQVSATYTGDSPTEIVQINSGYLPANYNHGYFYAGASNFTVATIIDNDNSLSTDLIAAEVRTNLLPGTSTQFQGYCIDLSHLITPGSYQWQVAYLKDVTVNGHGITTEQATAVQHLWVDHSANLSNSASNAAEFQMALWTLLYNYDAPNPTGVTFGAYGGNSAEIATAGDWASTAWSQRNVASGASIYALVNTNSPLEQSFSIAIVGALSGDPQVSRITAVPLPAAAGVGFSMLGGFGMLAGLRKRLRRRARIA